MPYSSEVRVWTATGDSPEMDVSLVLWELSTTIDNAGRVREQQVDQDNTTVSVSGGTTFPFSFVRGPDFLANNNHSISLAAYQAGGQSGPLFRSGRFETLPAGAPGNPDGLVDILLVDPMRVPMADINSMVAASLPMTLPDGNVINTITMTSAPPSDTLTLVATGPYGATTYTYTLPFVITPSDDQVDLTRVLEANAAGQGSLTFAAGPGGGFQAFINNLFAGLFVGTITGQVLAEITTRLNTAAATGAASAAAAAGFTSLPPGVNLGARRVAVASNGDLVIFPAVSSLGSLVNRFVAAAPPGQTGRCFIAAAVLEPDAVELSTLRTYRDERLAPTRAGRAAVRVYERLSPPLAEAVARHRTLRALTRGAIVRPAYLLARRSLRRRGRASA
jgi:hypothetical protein